MADPGLNNRGCDLHSRKTLLSVARDITHILYPGDENGILVLCNRENISTAKVVAEFHTTFFAAAVSKKRRRRDWSTTCWDVRPVRPFS